MKTSFDFLRVAKKLSLLATIFMLGSTSVLSIQAGSGSILSGKAVLAPVSTQEDYYDHSWSKGIGAPLNDTGASLAADGSGNVFVTGAFRGTVDFGGGVLPSAGGADIFLAKFDASGIHQWSKSLGSTEDDIGYSVAVDGSGNVFVTGEFRGSVNFGSGPLVSAGAADIFLVKYNADGVHQWSMSFGASQYDSGYSLAVDGSGNALVTGIYRGSVDFGGGIFTSVGGADIFLAKYSAGGIHQWSKSLGGSQDDTGNGLAVDGSGNVFVTGAYRQSVNFGGGALVSAGGSDIFLARYADDGIYAWSRSVGSSQDDYGFDLAVDGSGNILATGSFRQSVDFGGGALASAGGTDIYLVKYDTNNIHAWSKSLGGLFEDIGVGLDVDGAGNVFVTGLFHGSVDFGGGALMSAGFADIFLVGFDDESFHLWSKRFGGLDDDHGYGLIVDGSSAILMTGDFQGNIDFGGGALASVGNSDIFLARFIEKCRLFIPLILWQN